jgi:hypothetical protein
MNPLTGTTGSTFTITLDRSLPTYTGLKLELIMVDFMFILQE